MAANSTGTIHTVRITVLRGILSQKGKLDKLECLVNYHDGVEVLVPHREHEERAGDAEGHDPDERDLHDGVLLLLGVSVAQRVGEAHVAVDGDHAQVADGGRREQNVEAVPADTN